jgi:hypothetical protein
MRFAELMQIGRISSHKPTYQESLPIGRLVSTNSVPVSARFLCVTRVYDIGSSSECPRHHERKFFSPECAAVRSSSLIHDHIRAGNAQCFRPLGCVFKEERLLCANHEVRTWKWTQYNSGWFVAGAGRCAKDCTINLWMPNPESKG